MPETVAINHELSSPWSSGLHDACPVGGGEWFRPIGLPRKIFSRRESCCGCHSRTTVEYFILSGQMRSEPALRRAEQMFRLPSTSILVEVNRYEFSVRACQQCAYLLHDLYQELMITKILTNDLIRRLHRPGIDAYS
jgi:hypothetical protein